MATITAKRNAWVETDEKTGKKTKHPEATVSADIDFGDNIAAMVTKFGEGIVFSQAKAALTVAFQGWLRSQLDQGKTVDEIQTNAKSWKPGERKQGKSPREKLLEQLSSLSPEERAAILRDANGGGATAANKAPAGNKKK